MKPLRNLVAGRRCPYAVKTCIAHLDGDVGGHGDAHEFSGAGGGHGPGFFEGGVGVEGGVDDAEIHGERGAREARVTNFRAAQGFGNFHLEVAELVAAWSAVRRHNRVGHEYGFFEAFCTNEILQSEDTRRSSVENISRKLSLFLEICKKIK